MNRLRIVVHPSDLLYACHKAIAERVETITLFAFENEEQDKVEGAPSFHSSQALVWLEKVEESKDNDVVDGDLVDSGKKKD